MKKLTITLFLIFITSTLLALPKSVQADKYFLKIKELKESKNYEEAVNYFDKILKLKVKLPNDFYYHYGEMVILFKENYPEKKKFTYKNAKDYSEKYIDKTGKKGEFYLKALNGYSVAERRWKREVASVKKEVKVIKSECLEKNIKNCPSKDSLIKSLNKDPIDIRIKLCDLGVATSCITLDDYYFGLEHYQDYVKYAKKGCDLNNYTSCRSMAYAYDSGWGVKEDKSIALEFLKKAAKLSEKLCYEKNDMEACRESGEYYKNENINKEKSKVLYTKALNGFLEQCSKNIANGCFYVGWFYENAVNVDKDIDKAKRFYKKACDLKYSYGCRNLMWTYKKETSDYKLYKSRACQYGLEGYCD